MQSPKAAFEHLRSLETAAKSRSVAYRLEKLRRLKFELVDRMPLLHEAMREDFSKPEAEGKISEIYGVMMELDYALKHLKRWARPKRRGSPLVLAGFGSRVIPEPKGTVLILGAWNYPVYLTLSPFIAAWAAGNQVILKPSELPKRTSRWIAEILRAVFTADEVAVFEGGPEVSQELLGLRFDHIFFTGSGRVGKLVAEAAAKHLIPTTLELGGKSPAIVFESANVAQAAHRIAWGKFLNAGQTCVAPDYVLIHESLEKEFLEGVKAAIAASFGASDPKRLQSPDLAHIISSGHFTRLKTMLDEAVSQGAELVVGGASDPNTRSFVPTVVRRLPAQAGLLREEIFGPILPVVTFKEEAEAYAFIRKLEKPLSLYVFAGDRATVDRALHQTSSGGVTVNGTVLHLANPRLPFGGIGESGMGSYHGEAGFNTFSHLRSVLTWGFLDQVRLFYPPYTRRTFALLKFLIRWIR